MPIACACLPSVSCSGWFNCAQRLLISYSYQALIISVTRYCGCKKDLTLDHVVPVSKGGKNTWENLVTACMVCNQKKGHHSLSKLGWRLKHAPHQPTPYEIGVIMGVSQVRSVEGGGGYVACLRCMEDVMCSAIACCLLSCDSLFRLWWTVLKDSWVVNGQSNCITLLF